VISSLEAITYGFGVYPYQGPRHYIPQNAHSFVIPSNPVAFSAPSGRLQDVRAFRNVRHATKKVAPAVTSGGGSRTYVPDARAVVRMRNVEIPDMPIRLPGIEDAKPTDAPSSTYAPSTIPTPVSVPDAGACPLCPR
jgi:hypothetical protein